MAFFIYVGFERWGANYSRERVCGWTVRAKNPLLAFGDFLYNIDN